MPRLPRDERIIPDVPNHVITRGNNRRRLFSYPHEYETFIWLLGRATLEYGCHINALSVMANHTHQLLTPPSVQRASKCMAKVDQRYAQIRNQRRDGTGKVFEERFRSEPVLDETHLMNATMYIDANPVRAGVVKNAIDYRWSTYGLHVGEPQRSAIPSSMWTPSEWYRSLGRTMSESARCYRALFEDYVSRGLETELDDSDWRAFARRESPYSRRLLRPNGSYARERVLRFGPGRR
jgi:putative transposase